jgi:hypothetical protein
MPTPWLLCPRRRIRPLQWIVLLFLVIGIPRTQALLQRVMINPVVDLALVMSSANSGSNAATRFNGFPAGPAGPEYCNARPRIVAQYLAGRSMTS